MSRAHIVYRLLDRHAVLSSGPEPRPWVRRAAALCVALSAVVAMYLFINSPVGQSLYQRLGGYVEDEVASKVAREKASGSAATYSEQKRSDVLPRTTNDNALSLLPDTKYFLYSPSGGFNNQRIELEYALMIGKLINRTVIIPPMGKHSNHYNRYEVLTLVQLISMDRIFDFAKLNEFTPVISMGHRRIVLYAKALQERGYSVNTIFHERRLYWKQSDVLTNLVDIPEQVLYFRGAEMYHAWGFDVALSRKMFTTTRFTETIRRIAMSVIQTKFGGRHFNAMHVRVGDYAYRTPSMTEFKKQMDRHNFNRSQPLYIATEPSTAKAMFNSLCSEYSCVFSQDLKGNKDLEQYLGVVPSGQLRQDMLGVIEQLLCVAAKRFVGTYFSTFTAKIKQMREYRTFAFPECLGENVESTGVILDIDEETRLDDDERNNKDRPPVPLP